MRIPSRGRAATGRRRAAWAVPAGIAGIFAMAGAAWAGGHGDAALRVTWIPEETRQGEVFLLRVQGAGPLAEVAARFGGRPVIFWEEGRERRVFHALVGVDLEDAAGPTPAVIDAATGAGVAGRVRVSIAVRAASFPVQHLTVPRPFVDLDAPTLARVQRERARMEAVLAGGRSERLWEGPFRVPLEHAPAAHGFGARRIYNGEARAPHTGADFSAPAGTPVLASQGGVVALAEEHFFAGRAVVIDHGLHLFTMYFHLQELRARAGEAVRAGQVLGSVGASGRATGAHLHWGARLGGARIDPTALVRLPQ